MAREVTIGKRLLSGWTAIAARFGFVQTLVLLAVVYALMFGPFGLVIAVARRDFLGKRGLWTPGSAWLDADTAQPDLERAKLLS
jgi:hypothetical protein